LVIATVNAGIDTTAKNSRKRGLAGTFYRISTQISVPGATKFQNCTEKTTMAPTMMEWISAQQPQGI